MPKASQLKSRTHYFIKKNNIVFIKAERDRDPQP